jgi:copper chaperone CopZ
MTKKKYKINGMHCSSCATCIELDLEDKGIKASCSFVKQELEVEIEEGQEREVIQVVEQSGYKISS